MIASRIISIITCISIIASSIVIPRDLVFASQLLSLSGSENTGDLDETEQTTQNTESTESTSDEAESEESTESTSDEAESEESTSNITETEESTEITSDVEESTEITTNKTETTKKEDKAQEQAEDPYHYLLFDADTQTLRGFSSPINLDELVIPKEIRGVEVHHIADGAFDTKSFSSVKFEEGINLKTIGNEAFKGCTNLKSITIPPSVESIGDGAFMDCTTLGEIRFSPDNNLTSVGNNVFRNNTLLKVYDFHYNTNLTNIGDYMFYKINTFVTDGEEGKLIIPVNIQTIGNRAFYDLTAFNELHFEDNSQLQSIGSVVFTGNQDLKVYGLEKNANLQTIGSNAFSYIKDGYTTIPGVSAFVTATGEENKLIIPASVTSIGTSAFNSITSIVFLEFQDNSQIETIDSSAFNSCTGLQSIDFGDNSQIKTIGSNAFYRCTALQALDFGDNSTLETIGSNAFNGCTALQTLNFGDNSMLQTIGSSAFASCTKLKSVDFGDNSQLKTIDTRAFQSCSILSTVDFGANSKLETIKTEAFEYTSIREFNLGSAITTIEYEALNSYTSSSSRTTVEKITIDKSKADQGTVTGLPVNGYFGNVNVSVKPVIVKWTDTVETSDGYIFDKYDGHLQRYTGTAIDLTIPNQIEGVAIKSLGQNIFYNNSTVKSIVFEDGLQVETIKPYTFGYQRTIKDVNFGKNNQIQTIENNAFYSNSGTFDNVRIPSESITTIQNNAFPSVKRVFLTEKIEDSIEGAKWGARKVFWKGTYDNGDFIFNSNGEILEYIGTNPVVNIPSSITPNGARTSPITITSIKDYAFVDTEMQYQITEVTIPNTVTTIGVSAFDNCSALRVLNFEENSKLETISAYAFRNTPIESLEIPASVTTIGYSSFEGNKLTSLTFEENSNLLTIANYAFRNQKMTEVDIPDSLQKMTYAFYNCNNLETVNITPNSNLTVMTNNNFYGTKITSIRIPKKVTEIERYAFNNIRTLQEVIIDPDSTLEKIGENAFQGTSLKAISLPDSLKTIENEAFYNVTTLKTVDINETSLLERIDYSAFGRTGITSIYIPKGLKIISSSVFSGCTKLSTVTFAQDSKVTTIGSSAFYNTALTTINLPDIVTSLESGAFSNTPLTSIDLPSGLTSIGDDCFYNAKLTSVIIPNTVTSIGNEVFKGNRDLTTVTFEENSLLKTIENNVFENTQVKEVKIDSEVLQTVYSNAFIGLDVLYLPGKLKYSIANYTSWGVPLIYWKGTLTDATGEWLYDLDGNIIKYLGSKDVLEIPKELEGIDGVVTPTKYIGEKAFYNNKTLTTVTIGDNIQSIDQDAFYNCTALTSITIGNNVKDIKDRAFYNCTSLETLTFEEGSTLTTLGRQIFHRTKIKELVIPKSVTTINDTFKYSNSSNSYNDPAIEVVTFEDGSQLKAYPSFYGNQKIKKVLNVPDTIETIQGGTFSGCISLEYADLPQNEKIKEIPASMFNGCKSLTSIDIPSGIQTIGERAFSGCEKLEDIKLPEGLKIIRRYAFQNNKSLRELYIPNSVENLGDTDSYNPNTYTFSGCISLEYINIPTNSKLNTIKPGMFYGSTALKEIYIPRNIKSIEASAFRNCTSLENVIFEDSFDREGPIIGESAQLTTIGEYAFNNTALTSVMLPSSIERIGNNALPIGLIDIRIPQKRLVSNGETVNTVLTNSAYWGASTTKDVNFLSEFIVITVDKKSLQRLSPTEFKFNVNYNGYGLKIENISYNDSEPKVMYNTDIASFKFGESDEAFVLDNILDIKGKQEFRAVGIFEKLDIARAKNMAASSDGKVRETFTSNTVIDNFISYVDKDENGNFVHINQDIDKDGQNDFFDAKRYNDEEIATVVSSIPEKTGYNFLGWSLTPPSETGTRTLTVDYAPGANIKILDNVILYPVWQEIGTKTLTLDYGLSTQNPDRLETNKNGIVDITGYTNPHLDYYAFDGWYLDNNTFSNKVSFLKDDQGNLTNKLYIKEDTTIYAKWTEGIVTVKYKANGGRVSGLSLDGSGAYVDTVKYKDQYDLKQPTKNNNDFKGWFIEINGTKEKITNGQDIHKYVDGKTMTVELEAKWEQQPTETEEESSSETTTEPTTTSDTTTSTTTATTTETTTESTTLTTSTTSTTTESTTESTSSTTTSSTTESTTATTTEQPTESTTEDRTTVTEQATEQTTNNNQALPPATDGNGDDNGEDGDIGGNIQGGIQYVYGNLENITPEYEELARRAIENVNIDNETVEQSVDSMLDNYQSNAGKINERRLTEKPAFGFGVEGNISLLIILLLILILLVIGYIIKKQLIDKEKQKDKDEDENEYSLKV